MEFRPCIDIHNGKVKQIVGSSLADEGDRAVENFVAGADAAYYAHLYVAARLFPSSAKVRIRMRLTVIKAVSADEKNAESISKSTKKII